MDYISILDVMYLVPLIMWAGILKKCYDSLKPGGWLLLKEMNTGKPGKLAILKAEETLAVNIFGLTMGEKNTFTFPPPEEVRRQLKSAGFDVEQVPLDRGYHVPHMLWIGHKPEDPDARPSAEAEHPEQGACTHSSRDKEHDGGNQCASDRGS